MTIVSISRGSYSLGEEVSEKVAERLGYTCLARDALFQELEALKVPEIKLVQSMESPSILARLFGSTGRYVAYIRAALLKHVCDDNIVYHGLAGGFFLANIPHALKVRIVADVCDRVAIGVKRDSISKEEARQTVEQLDKTRRKWGMHLYGIDPEDPSLYDAVFHVGKLGVDVAATMICDLVKQETFRTTPASQAALEDMALEAEIEAMIVNLPDRPDAEIAVHDGEANVRLTTPRVRGGSSSTFSSQYLQQLQERILRQISSLPGFKSLTIERLE